MGESNKWSVNKRLEFIERRLYWAGSINRADIIKAFRVSVPQASMDLKAYQKMGPSNMRYDPKEKTYKRSGPFQPVFGPIQSEQALDYLIAGNDDSAEGIHEVPIDKIPSINRNINPLFLQKILTSISRKKDIELKYQSFHSNTSTWRWIAPRAIVWDSLRWHTRAFCFSSGKFKDFVLGRIVEVNDNFRESLCQDSDPAWETFVGLELVPDNDLTPGQRKGVEKEYEMENGKKIVSVRVCLASYFAKRHGLFLKKSDIRLNNADQINQIRKACNELELEQFAGVYS